MDKLEKPEWLDPELAKIWDELESQVKLSIGQVGMEALCTQVYRMRDAQQRISAEGLVVADSKGNPVPHPALAVEKQAQAEIRQWISKFGVGV